MLTFFQTQIQNTVTNNKVLLEIVCYFSVVHRLVNKEALPPVVDLLMSLQENSDATVRYCSIIGAKVEEVTGNVSMTVLNVTTVPQ